MFTGAVQPASRQGETRQHKQTTRARRTPGRKLARELRQLILPFLELRVLFRLCSIM